MVGRFEIEGDTLVCYLDGELNAGQASKLRVNYLSQLNQPVERHVIDMSGVVAIDSSSLGAFVQIFKQLKAQKKELSMRGLQGQPAEAVSFLGLDKVIPVT